MSEIKVLSALIVESFETIKSSLHRLESKVDLTNGRIREIENWKIEHETADKAIKKINLTKEKNYRAPIFVSLVTGMVILIGQFIIDKL